MALASAFAARSNSTFAFAKASSLIFFNSFRISGCVANFDSNSANNCSGVFAANSANSSAFASCSSNSSFTPNSSSTSRNSSRASSTFPSSSTASKYPAIRFNAKINFCSSTSALFNATPCPLTLPSVVTFRNAPKTIGGKIFSNASASSASRTRSRSSLFKMFALFACARIKSFNASIR